MVLFFNYWYMNLSKATIGEIDTRIVDDANDVTDYYGLEWNDVKSVKWNF